MRVQTNVGAVFETHLDQGFHNVRITYEGLLREPACILDEVCKLVGLAFEHGMDAPYESGFAVASFAAASFVATTDPKL